MEKLTNEQLKEIIKFYDGDKPSEGTANWCAKQCATELLSSRAEVERLGVESQKQSISLECWKEKAIDFEQEVKRLTDENTTLEQECGDLIDGAKLGNGTISRLTATIATLEADNKAMRETLAGFLGNAREVHVGHMAYKIEKIYACAEYDRLRQLAKG